jgi:hypothetical protein
METLKNRITDGSQDSETGFWSVLAILALIFVALVFSGCSSTAARQESISGSSAELDEFQDCQNVDSLGIRIGGMNLSAAGSMLDFRYRVIDPARAAPLFDRKVRPYLLDESSGAAFGVPDTPKLGQLRTTRRNSDAATGKDYHILFANPGHLLQAGQKVSLVIGDIRVENLVVR